MITPFPRDPRYGATPDGRVFRIARVRFGAAVPYELKSSPGFKGYLYVGNGSGKGLQRVSVHRVIAETFIPNPDGLPEVAHRNGVKTENAADNLRWSSNAANQADRLTHGTHNRGSRQTNHKLTEVDVLALRRGLATPREIAARVGASYRHVVEVRNGKDWPHVSAR